MDSAYVPNNPQFGLQLECNWTASPCGAEPGADLWSEDMASFALPLDLDPLPSLFPFSPGQPQPPQGYKTEPSFSTIPQKQPQGADVADVLLSLKHAVVHPSGSPAVQEPLCHLLSSPSGYPDQPFTQQCFPSMSVNVSMNMTMHAGYPPPPTSVGGYGGCGADITCPQMQWNATPQGSSPVSYQTQGLLSPSYGGTTYSFTADFRPPQDSSMLGSYKPVPMSFSPPRKRYSVNLIEDDSQKPNVCRICGKSYARPSTLKTHLRTHSGEKPYRCIDCNKSFSQAANLTAHVRTHSGEKPFRCPVCDRRFSQSSSVTTHMRTHSGERPYRCRLCRKAFSDSSTLTKHLRIHSGEKPYECKLCLLRFSQSGNLNRHMRVHAGQVGGYQPP